MVVLQGKGSQQSSRNIVLIYAAYDDTIKRTVIHIQEMKKECMMILKQNKVRLVNDEKSRRKPDYSSGIYLTASKVLQYRLVDENLIEKEEEKRKQQRRQPPESYI